MKVIGLVALVFVVTVECQTTPSPVLTQFMAKVRTTVSELFQRADTNHNGHFDTQDVDSIFSEYDDDGDKLVSRTEFVNRFSNHSALLRPVAMGLFIDMDMDKNGQLDPADTQLYFNKIDKNDDGQVDHQEFINYFTQLFEVLFILALQGQATNTAAP